VELDNEKDPTPRSILEPAKPPFPAPARNAMPDLLTAHINDTKELASVSHQQQNQSGGHQSKNSLGLKVITNPGNAFDNLHLSFLPTRKNFLGEGRYGRVYLGQYTIENSPMPDSQKKGSLMLGSAKETMENRSTSTPTSTTNTNISKSSQPDPKHSHNTSNPSAEFKTCAVKRLHNSSECQAIGFAELFILRRIGNHPHIVQLIGAKDETDLESASYKKRIKNSLTDATSPITPVSTPSLLSMSKEEVAPRLLLLLGFESGGNMWDYIEEHKDVGIGKSMWLKWSRQLASAVDYVHSFGIVHHDIKPHNCLVCF
jgi:serine/threonine protein kinase